MTIFYWLLNWLAFIIVCAARRPEIDWLEVVPHLENVEKFYQQIRKQNAKLYDGKEHTSHAYAKNLICWNLLASGFFDMTGVELEPIDMNMVWVYYELKLMYPEIMKKLYEEVPVSKSTPELTKFRYLNPTFRINVNLEKGSVPEYAFLCLGRHRSTTKITEFYVSEEYQVGDGSLSRAVGRFMFTSSGEGVDERIKVYLFAEEPAKILTNAHYNIEHLYVQSRENKEPAKSPDSDPLCSLSVKEQVQICTSILSSPHFDDDVDYVPDIDVAPTECNKRKIALSSGDSANYDEWMMECAAISSEDDLPITYYLSQAYDPHKVFVFRPKSDATEEVMTVETLCVNIRNVKG